MVAKISPHLALKAPHLLSLDDIARTRGFIERDAAAKTYPGVLESIDPAYAACSVRLAVDMGVEGRPAPVVPCVLPYNVQNRQDLPVGTPGIVVIADYYIGGITKTGPPAEQWLGKSPNLMNAVFIPIGRTDFPDAYPEGTNALTGVSKPKTAQRDAVAGSVRITDSIGGNGLGRSEGLIDATGIHLARYGKDGDGGRTTPNATLDMTDGLVASRAASITEDADAIVETATNVISQSAGESIEGKCGDSSLVITPDLINANAGVFTVNGTQAYAKLLDGFSTPNFNRQLISGDAGNILSQGGDGRLFVPSVAVGAPIGLGSDQKLYVGRYSPPIIDGKPIPPTSPDRPPPGDNGHFVCAGDTNPRSLNTRRAYYMFLDKGAGAPRGWWFALDRTPGCLEGGVEGDDSGIYALWIAGGYLYQIYFTRAGGCSYSSGGNAWADALAASMVYRYDDPPQGIVALSMDANRNGIIVRLDAGGWTTIWPQAGAEPPTPMLGGVRGAAPAQA